ncbi:MAG: hypothetical protein V7606_778 [Burkholderiales bacterium]
MPLQRTEPDSASASVIAILAEVQVHEVCFFVSSPNGPKPPTVSSFHKPVKATT